MSILNWLITLLMLGVSLSAIIGIRIWNQLFLEGDVQGGFVIGTLIAVASSTVTAVSNFVLKVVITYITDWEGCDTETEHEASIFTKLSFAYVATSRPSSPHRPWCHPGLPSSPHRPWCHVAATSSTRHSSRLSSMALLSQ